MHRTNSIFCAFPGLGESIRDDQVFRDEVTIFLHSLNWDEKEIKEIFTVLLTHLEDPRTPEAMIVHDANYVEVLGALGIAKAFTTGGARGQTYETTVNIFENNLNRAVFHTPEGIRLATGIKWAERLNPLDSPSGMIFLFD